MERMVDREREICSCSVNLLLSLHVLRVQAEKAVAPTPNVTFQQKIVPWEKKVFICDATPRARALLSNGPFRASLPCNSPYVLVIYIILATLHSNPAIPCMALILSLSVSSPKCVR